VAAPPATDVLIVEDSAVTAKAVQFLLAQIGFVLSQLLAMPPRHSSGCV
jgi:hypothetical protein